MAQGDLNQQLGIQEKINKLLAERSQMVDDATKMLAGQTKIAMELCKALDCEDLAGMPDRINEIQESMEEASESAQRFGDEAAAAGERAAAGARKASKGFSVAAGAGAGAAAGLVSGFKGALAMIKGVGEGIKTVITTLFGVGKAILSLPFKVMGGLVDMAQSGGGGPNPIKVALEEVRKEMGSLATNEGKALADSVGTLKGQMRDLGGTGVSLKKIYGRGREGLAAALKDLTATAVAMGPVFSKLKDEFAKNAGEILAFKKALGLAEEDMAAFGKQAVMSGKPVTDVLTEHANLAVQMGEKFHINAKVVSKGMMEMTKDVGNFGNMARSEIVAATVYMHELGMETKDFLGLVDKFDNFEDAAEGASMLAQSFGMNVDAMKMMNEQNPAKRMDMLRESFQATGKSVEDLSRQELKLLASQMNISEEAAKMALSNENMGKSFDEIQAAAQGAEDAPLTQAEAMNKLADSMEKVFGSGGGKKFKGFMDAFLQGFGKGIKRTKIFRKLMRNIRKSLKVVYKAGKAVGKLFVDMFPGVKDMLGSLADLFDPKRIKAMMSEVVGLFKDFFKDLATDPQAGVEKFIERLKEVFGRFFGSKSGMGKQFMEGAGKFMTALGGIFKGLLTVALKGLTKLLNGLADAIRNPPQMKSAFGEALMMFGKSIIDIFKALGPPLWEALKNLFSAIWEKLEGSEVVEKAKKILMGILISKILIAAALGAVKGAASVIMLNIIGPWFQKMALGGDQIPTPPATKGGTPDGLKKVDDLADAAGNTRANWKDAMIKGAMIVLFIVVTIVALAAAFFVAAQIIKKLSTEDIIKTGIFMVTVGLFAAALGGAIKMMKGTDFKGAIQDLVIIGIAILGIAYLSLIVGPVIKKSASGMPDAVEVTKWGFAMGVVITMGAFAAGLAGLAALSFKAVGGPMNIIIGLGILALAMFMLGVVGLAIGGMLSLIPDPGGVAKVMGAIAKIMLVTMLMLPVAGVLGLMLMSVPWGSAGIGIISAGFGVLVTLASAMVASLMPAIIKLASIKLTDPSSFEKVTNALINIIKAIAAFAEAVARIMEAIKPGIGAALSEDGGAGLMRKNIEAVTTMIDAIMEPVKKFIGQLMDLAMASGIEGESVNAVQAISSVIQAMGTLMKAFSPSDAAFKAVEEANSFWDPMAASRLMSEVSSGMKETIEAAIPMIKEVGNLVVKIAKLVEGADFSAVGPLLNGLGPVLGGIAGLMKSLNPSDGEMKAVSKAAETWGGDEVGLMKEINKRMVMGMKAMKPLIVIIATELGSMVTTHLKPLIAMIGTFNIDPQAMAAVAEILSALMGGMGQMLSAVGPAMEVMQKNVKTYHSSFKPTRAEQMSAQMDDFGNMITKMGSAFTGILPSIKDFVIGLKGVADTIHNPEVMGKQMNVIATAIKTIGVVMGAMTDAVKLLETAKTGSWTDEVTWWFKEGGAIDKIINSVGKNVAAYMIPLSQAASGIGNPEVAGKQMKVIVDAVGIIGTLMSAMGDVVGLLTATKTGRWTAEVDWYFKEGGTLDKVINSVGAGVGRLVMKLKTGTSEMGDPDAMGKRMGVIVQAVEVISTMVKALGDVITMFGTTLTGTWTEEVAWYFGPPGDPEAGVVMQIVKSIGPAIGKIVTTVTASVKGIGKPEKMVSQIAVIGVVLSAVSEFITVVSQVLKIKAPKGSGGVMSTIANVTAQVVQDMPTIVNAVTGIKLPKGTRSKMKTLGKVMGAVGDFATAIGQLTKAGGPGGFDVEKFKTLIDDAGKLMSPEYLPRLASLISKPKFERGNTKRNSKVMRYIAEFMVAYSEMSTSLKNVVGGAKFDVIKFRAMISDVGTLMTPHFLPLLANLIAKPKFKRGNIKGNAKTMGYIAEFMVAYSEMKSELGKQVGTGAGFDISIIKEMITDVGKLMQEEGLPMLATNIGKTKLRSGNIKNNSKVMGKLSTFMTAYSSLEGDLSGFAGSGMTIMGSTMTAIAEDINQVNTAIETLPNMDISAKLSKKGKDLWGDAEISIEHKPINLNLKVNVTMDAKKLGEALEGTFATTGGG